MENVISRLDFIGKVEQWISDYSAFSGGAEHGNISVTENHQTGAIQNCRVTYGLNNLFQVRIHFLPSCKNDQTIYDADAVKILRNLDEIINQSEAMTKVDKYTAINDVRQAAVKTCLTPSAIDSIVSFTRFMLDQDYIAQGRETNPGQIARPRMVFRFLHYDQTKIPRIYLVVSGLGGG